MDGTIVAVASPPGRAARAVIRVSGVAAPGILQRLERAERSRPRGVFKSRLFLPFGELPALIVAAPGPRSYTGEDSFELLIPGNPDLAEMVVDAIIAAGRGLIGAGNSARDDRGVERDAGFPVRRAEPGEFSLRAFLHGRLTLEQAEGVSAAIAARTDAQLRAARHLLRGTLGRSAARLLESLTDMLAMVEAGIDFTDQEDVVAIAPRVLCAGLRAALGEVTSILGAGIPLEKLEAAPWVVLSGRPNAGKSALFNALLRQDRAVVAALEGTTRDALVEPWSVPVDGGHMEVLLVDAPGEFDAAAPSSDESAAALLDRLGQEARAQAIERATLLLRCHAVDAGTPPAASVGKIMVLTKCDLPHAPGASGAVHTSARTGVGLAELARAVGAAFAGGAATSEGEGLALGQRHRALLADAAQDLRRAIDAAAGDEDKRNLSAPELVADAMRLAVDHLGGIAGRVAPDDILGRIFARFCIGK